MSSILVLTSIPMRNLWYRLKLSVLYPNQPPAVSFLSEREEFERKRKSSLSREIKTLQDTVKEQVDIVAPHYRWN